MVPADDIHGTHITATKKFLDEFQAVHILAHARLRREFYRGEAIGPRMWGYVTPSLQPMTMVFIGRVLDKASGTNYGILPPPDWQSTFGLEELPRGRIILGNPGRGNTILDAFYTKQMEHLKEMMELEAADMGLTMINDPIMPSRGTINDRIHVILGKRYTSQMGAFLDGPPEPSHIGAMFPICNIPDEQTRVLLGNPTNAFIQQAIFDKSFQLVKPWEETDALSSGTLVGVEAELRMEHVGTSLVWRFHMSTIQIIANANEL